MKIGNNLTDKTGRGLKFLCIGLLLSVTLIWGCGIIATDEALTGKHGCFHHVGRAFFTGGGHSFRFAPLPFPHERIYKNR